MIYIHSGAYIIMGRHTSDTLTVHFEIYYAHTLSLCMLG